MGIRHPSDQRTLSLALCAPRNWSGLCVWVEADDELQDAEEKTPLLIFHKHCHESAAHDGVLQGYICRRGQQGELGWAREHTFSKFPALILDSLWLLWEDYDLLSPFAQRVDFVLETSFSYRSVIVSWSQFYKPYFSKCSTSRLLFFTYNGDKSNNYGVH